MLAHPIMNNTESSTLAPTPRPPQPSHPPLVARQPLGVAVPAGNTGLGNLQGSPPVVAEEPPGVSRAGAESTATHVTTGSNAFEGALDGFDFGFDSFGIESTMSFPGELLNDGYQQMEI